METVSSLVAFDALWKKSHPLENPLAMNNLVIPVVPDNPIQSAPLAAEDTAGNKALQWVIVGLVVIGGIYGLKLLIQKFQELESEKNGININ